LLQTLFFKHAIRLLWLGISKIYLGHGSNDCGSTAHDKRTTENESKQGMKPIKGKWSDVGGFLITNRQIDQNKGTDDEGRDEEGTKTTTASEKDIKGSKREKRCD
jgi:hypothetical protein